MTAPTLEQIRQLAAGDLSSLLQLYTHLHRADEPPPSRAVAEATWAAFLADPHFLCFGGHEGDKLVTSCMLVVVPNLTRGCRPYGLVENVVTHADYRGLGWGRAVLAHALHFAWRRGCYKVMLMTGRKDEGIARFYRSAGFEDGDKQAFVARPRDR